MALDDVNDLGDPREELSGFEPDAEETEKGEEEEKEKKGRSLPLPLPLLIVLVLSPLVVFGTMWLARPAVAPPTPEVIPADTLAVAVDSLHTELAPDTVAVEAAVQDTLPERDPDLPPPVSTGLLDSARQQGYYLDDQGAQQKFIEQLALMRDRLSNQRMKVNQLERQVADKEVMAEVMEKLRDENYTLKERLDYMEKTLPNEVVRQLLSYEEERRAKAAKASASGESSAGKGANARRMAKIYESMKPAEAARIFKKLSDDEVTSILQGMRPRNAAKVMAAMDVGFSARISKRMGGSN